MTSSLAKSKQIIGVHFQTLFSTIFLFFDVPQYSNRFDILIVLNTYDQQFTLTNKNHCISSLSAMQPVWLVHGSYAGRCGWCVVYMDRSSV